MSEADQTMQASQPLVQPPGPHRLMGAITAIQQKRAELLEADPDLADDESELLDLLYAEPDEQDALRVVERLARAAQAMRQRHLLADTEAKRLKARADRYEARCEALKHLTGEVLRAVSLKKHVAYDFTVSWRALAPEVQIENPKALPADYKITETVTTEKPDKDKLREALENGEVIEGVGFGPPRYSVTLRAK